MKTSQLIGKENALAGNQVKTLLIVGPKPPPIGGSPLTVQAMLDELRLYLGIRVDLINTSPTLDVRKKMTGFNFEKVWRFFLVLSKYWNGIRRCDVIIVFANDLFVLTMIPILFLGARIFRKSFFLKPVGASLDLSIAAQKKPLRWYVLKILHSLDGILAQTTFLKEQLERLGCENVYYLPGCRPNIKITRTPRTNSEKFQLIFLAHITRPKGPLILLTALQNLAQTCDQRITCDFFGPVHDDVRDEFFNQLSLTPTAKYCGVANAGIGSELIAEYDALVVPTFFEAEGHPGVLIEAMQAGVPVITTQIRSISDLINDGENGLVIPPQNSVALSEAIRKLATEPVLRERMGAASFIKGHEFRADVVVARMLKIVFPSVALKKE